MSETRRPAPEFALYDQNGKLRSLSEWRGRKIVLYFYPKDMTSGCTCQAVGFAELYPKFAEKGVEIIGVSRDSVASHKKFEEKNSLPFVLLSDPDRVATEAYGVWREKKNYGKTAMGVVRSSFIIDEEGFITGEFIGVRSQDNPRKMLEEIEKTIKDL